MVEEVELLLCFLVRYLDLEWMHSELKQGIASAGRFVREQPLSSTWQQHSDVTRAKPEH